MNRTLTETTKLSTQFGKVFVHVDKTPDGRIVGVGLSVQGRLHDSAIGLALDDISQAMNDSIGED